MEREVERAEGGIAAVEWTAELNEIQIDMFAVYAEEARRNPDQDDAAYIRDCADAVDSIFAAGWGASAPFSGSHAYTRDYVDGFLDCFLELYRETQPDNEEFTPWTNEGRE